MWLNFTATKLSKSQFFVQEIDELKRNDLLTLNNASNILDGSYPKLIDEWQLLPEIWDKIRSQIDKSHGQKNMYILTGSSSLYDKKRVFHSGAGRIAKIKMNTLTYCEFYETNKVSLKSLLNGQDVDLSKIKGEENIDNVIDYIFCGGWPSIIENRTNTFAKQYVNSILNMNVEGIPMRYQKTDALKILKSISRLVGSQLKKQTIISDMGSKIAEVTLEKYLDVFNGIYLTFDLFPWGASNIRSKYKMRTKPKIYLCDTSIGLSCLGVNSKEQLFYDLNTLGIYFENLVVKDLLSFSEVNDAEMYFYRNELGEEIDVIMVMPNGEWAAIEIKLANSYTQNEEHVRKMNKILSQIEPKYGKKKPILKMIVTGHGYSYKIGDTFVIPIQLLDLF